jgi:holo-[acyl-carrier protein] synthase
MRRDSACRIEYYPPLGIMADSEIPAGVSVGVDLVDIERFERVIERWGDRFLNRVFTPDERRTCLETARPVMHLAARFAAKEAIFKVLGGRGVSWREINMPRTPGRRSEPRLSGNTARLLGSRKLSVSLSHTNDQAVAVAALA